MTTHTKKTALKSSNCLSIIFYEATVASKRYKQPSNEFVGPIYEIVDKALKRYDPTRAGIQSFLRPRIRMGIYDFVMNMRGYRRIQTDYVKKLCRPRRLVSPNIADQPESDGIDLSILTSSERKLIVKYLSGGGKAKIHAESKISPYKFFNVSSHKTQTQIREIAKKLLVHAGIVK
jgi:hypothetical protein